jgi:Zn-dependent protease
MNYLGLSLGNIDWTIVAIGMVVWFLQMGLHEGAHAFMAWRAGDDIVRAQGKVTANPFRHIDWNKPISVILGVVMPFFTMVTVGFPMGMAWVNVHPGLFRRGEKDDAIVSFAGPAADFILSIMALLIMLLMWPILREQSAAWMRLLWVFLFMMYFVSFVYGVVSMIPIPPLDGSRVLYYFGNSRLRHFIRLIEPYGMIIYVILFFALGAGRLLHPLFEKAQELFVLLPSKVWGS